MPHNYAAIPQELKDIREKVNLIRERVTYDPNTGKVYYKARTFDNPSPRNKQWNTRFADKEAGYEHDGYVRVRLVDVGELYAHQIAFVCMEGYIPIEVDHEDKNRSNNKWNNLRDADRTLNSCNVFQRKQNKTGLKGVSWSKRNNRWRMDLQYQKKKYYSHHLTQEEAYKAYCELSAKLHGEFGCVE